MTAGPLRRATAGTALLALSPIAYLILTDALTPEEAVVRAVTVVAVVLVVGQLIRAVLAGLLQHVERSTPDAAGEAGAAGDGRSARAEPRSDAPPASNAAQPTGVGARTGEQVADHPLRRKGD